LSKLNYKQAKSLPSSHILLYNPDLSNRPKMAPRTITVFGATGSQGSSVINSLLKNASNDFTLRGITRNADSDKSKALGARGVEMVQANGLLKDEVVLALKGSWGVFINTNSDDPVRSVRLTLVDGLHLANTGIQAIGQPGGPSETDLGKIIADAAAEVGVQHFVYSGMQSASKITHGAVPNQAFDGTC
jgi:nucleoside-diphosphate-sugar epimerase